ncbi:hypothetical protein VE03_10220 [Pseudogymnoascus sp. 23342-1-I1]|nr:hypothetical protein VE03_10220 [Pseudogymnoascus sp. 23342-1-I1]
MKPELELEMMPDILCGILDESIFIRKRAIKILKGIYLRSQAMDIKIGVARTLLRRVVDLDQTVREVVYQTIKEIWISPFYWEASTLKTTPLSRPPLINHLNLISNSIRRDHHMVERFITASQAILAATKSTASLQVFALFVAQMFDMVVNNSATDGDGLMDRGAMFQLLAIFARTNASVFTTKQIQILQPYISKVDTEEDMVVYRSAISVLFHALPLVPNADTTCLRSIKRDLIRHISRVSRPILNEVIPCLRAISEIIQDNKLLTSLAVSCLEKVRKMEGVDLQDPASHEAVRKAIRLLNIAGMCGKHCNLEAEVESFRMRCAGWSGNSVAEFMISTFTSFSSSDQPMRVREAALDAISMVCHSWPKQFTSSTVHTQFKGVFEKDENTLLGIVLKSFKEFFLAIEKHSEVYKDGRTKLGDIAESEIDRAAAFIMQRFCKYVMEIALATQGHQGLLAVEILASMNRQGIIHPKECATICVALGTSQNREIAELSFSMHQILHSKFEVIMQRQYIRAVHAAYEYQRDVVRNLRGATYDPYLSVLHRTVEVLNTGKAKTRKKLYKDLCAETNLDLSQTSGIDIPQYLQRSLFIIENLAFLEYVSVDELDTTTIAMENVFARASVVVTDAIEIEVLGGTLLADESEGISQRRLCVLAAFSAVLSSIRDTTTYLRQQYDFSSTRSKAPIRRDTINGRSFWLKISTIMATLDSRENMLTQCHAFVNSYWSKR